MEFETLKVTLDALQGALYDDDKQVRKIIAEVSDQPREGGGLSVLVVPV